MASNERSYSTLDYLRLVAESTTLALSFAASDLDRWRARRETLVARLRQLLGGFRSERGNLNAAVIESTQADGYVREKIVFDRWL